MRVSPFPKNMRSSRPPAYIPNHTGYVVYFPGRPRMWFEPQRAADAMDLLQSLIRDHLAVSGRPPKYAGIAYQQGQTEIAQGELSAA